MTDLPGLTSSLVDPLQRRQDSDGECVSCTYLFPESATFPGADHAFEHASCAGPERRSRFQNPSCNSSPPFLLQSPSTSKIIQQLIQLILSLLMKGSYHIPTSGIFFGTAILSRISASTLDHRTWWHRLSLLGPNCAETQIAKVGCWASSVALEIFNIYDSQK